MYKLVVDGRVADVPAKGVFGLRARFCDKLYGALSSDRRATELELALRDTSKDLDVIADFAIVAIQAGIDGNLVVPGATAESGLKSRIVRFRDLRVLTPELTEAVVADLKDLGNKIPVHPLSLCPVLFVCNHAHIGVATSGTWRGGRTTCTNASHIAQLTHLTRRT